ncbi:major facilitator superfamily domain-containing protein [Ilyonectria robusta]|uniref:major facilitator superfamily domain-containing protein n=1 Tax=Ilyonectria robusta TaxID=1079257 RepID=UPI001E8E141E|nr:major facilitator superfamily domain-containing protein [Ilyonectria robusta]KAH8656341.1 major facilitator superfamily domain-containing protein [Ilyonectria robusta]
MDFISIAQLFGLIGSGFLAVQTTLFFGHIGLAGWLPQILAIFTLALNIPLSHAADYWGRKWIIVICSLGGTVGPLVIARANNVATLIAGQCIFGIAFGCQSSFYAIISEVLPRKYRSAGQASINFATAVGSILAMLTAGLLMRGGKLENYRIFWYIACGIYTAGNLGIFFGYRPPPRELQTTMNDWEKLKSLDWIGLVFVAVGLTLFCIGLTWSSNPYGWDDAHVTAPFVVGIVLLICFGIYEWRGTGGRLINRTLFKDRNFAIALFAMFMEGLSFFTTNSYLVREITLLYDSDTLIASTPFMIVFIVTIFMSPVVGIYTTVAKSLRNSLVIGFVFITLYNALMATLTPSSPKGCAWGYPVFAGIGLSTVIINSMVAAQMSSPPELLSITSGFVVSARGIGGAVGMAINNAIFSSALEKNLGNKVAAALAPFDFPLDKIGAVIEAFESQSQQLVAQVLEGNTEMIGAAFTAYKNAYSIAFRNTWITAASFSCIGIFISAFFRDDKSRFDDHIDAAVQEDIVRHQAEKEDIQPTMVHRENLQDLEKTA